MKLDGSWMEEQVGERVVGEVESAMHEKLCKSSKAHMFFFAYKL